MHQEVRGSDRGKAANVEIDTIHSHEQHVAP